MFDRHDDHAIAVGDDDVTWDHAHATACDRHVLGIPFQAAWADAAGDACGIDRDLLDDQFVGIATAAIADHAARASDDPAQRVVRTDKADVAHLGGVDDDDLTVVDRFPGPGRQFAVPAALPGYIFLEGHGTGHDAAGRHKAHGVGDAIDAVCKALEVAPQGADVPVHGARVDQAYGVQAIAHVGEAQALVHRE